MRPPYQLIAPGARRGNRFWIVRGRRPDHREFEASTRCEDSETARRVAADIYARIVAEGPAPAAAVKSFADAADAYVRWRNPSPADFKRIERLVARLGSTPIREVGQDDLVRAAKAHERAVSGATLNREYVRPL